MHTGKLRGAYRESDSSLVYAHEYGFRAAVSAWSCQLEGHVRPPHGPEARATAHLKMHHAPWGDEHESTCPQRQIRTSPAPSASVAWCALAPLLFRRASRSMTHAASQTCRLRPWLPARHITQCIFISTQSVRHMSSACHLPHKAFLTFGFDPQTRSDAE